MLRKKYYLYLDNQEYSILLKSLVALKNKLIQQERFADCVDELIMKVTVKMADRVVREMMGL